jgi:hypothetical protein
VSYCCKSVIVQAAKASDCRIPLGVLQFRQATNESE